MDALSVWDRITSGAALALALVPNETATRFARPTQELGDVVRTVAARVRRGNAEGAARRVTRWVDRELYPAVLDVVPTAGRVVPREVAEAFGVILVWGVKLATVGPLAESKGDEENEEGPADTRSLVAGRVPGMPDALHPAAVKP